MMDGQVARIGKMSSTFGALYDSVLDRYSELTVFFGICFYLINQGYVISSIVAFIALIGSLMVSYVRARAEGLGLECKVGFMQRPERVVLTGLGALCCGIFAPMMENNEIFEPIMICLLYTSFQQRPGNPVTPCPVNPGIYLFQSHIYPLVIRILCCIPRKTQT